MTDILHDPLIPPNTPRVHRRHVWVDGACRCGATYDPAKSLRGRRARNRGLAIEREVAHSLGMRLVGKFGTKADGRGEMFAAQIKSGVVFPERAWRWLKEVPANEGQVPVLILADTPGAGHRRRGLVLLDLEDWRALHGETLG